MQFAEISLMAAGALLILLAAYLGAKQKTESGPSTTTEPDSSPSLDNAVKLQRSLMELAGELYTLSQDVTVDLERKLSELKELLELVDTRLAEAPAAESQPDEEASVETPAPELEIIVENEDAPPPERYQEVYEMADRELPIDEIARRTQMGKGEIQLILSLRKKD